jgi:cystathionine beta-lyase
VVIDPAYTQNQVDAFCDSLQLFKLGYSWAGPVSLVVPYNLARMRGAWPAAIAPGTLVRFAVGFEAVEDLQADIAQALRALTHP